MTRWIALAFEHRAQRLGLVVAGGEEDDEPRGVEHRRRQRDAKGALRLDPRRHHPTLALVHGLAAWKQRRGVRVLAEAEQDEIEARPLSGRCVEELAKLRFISLCGDLGV